MHGDAKLPASDGARAPKPGTRNSELGTGRHILFVYGNLSQLGGIQTLIVRLSRRLHELGHRVTIVLQQDMPVSLTKGACTGQAGAQGGVSSLSR